VTEPANCRKFSTSSRWFFGLDISWLCSLPETIERVTLASIAFYILLWFFIVIDQESLGFAIFFAWLQWISILILLIGAVLSAKFKTLAILARIVAAFGFWAGLWVVTFFSLGFHVVDSKPKYGAELMMTYLICMAVFWLLVKCWTNAILASHLKA
jgi:uncharacterized integral membrane protein